MEEGAVTQTMAWKQTGSWTVRLTLSLHLHGLFDLWRSVDVLFISNVPSSAGAGFSFKCGFSHQPSIGFMQLCHYFC